MIWERASQLFPIYSNSNCRLELGVFGIEDAKNEFQKRKSMEVTENRFEGDIVDNLGPELDRKPKADREKWELLSRELAQKQEIIHRMMNEIDDKSQSLKLTVII